MIKVLFLCTTIFVLAVSCSDQTFKDLPLIDISSSEVNYQNISEDSTVISQGLFYRQLKERRFEQIFGHAHFIYSDQVNGKNMYDLILLSAQRDGQQIKLLCSIDATFYSVIDMVTYQSIDHKLISLQRSNMASTFTDIKLLNTPENDHQQDTLLIQVDDAGLFEQVPFCCDF